MKMVMTLTVSEGVDLGGRRIIKKKIDAGSLIAHLELDDHSLVTKAQEYKGQFPGLEVSTPVVRGKLNHMNASYRVMLENILSGTFIFIKLVQ
jgi:acetyl-CoA carboxylase/biotin carboxylase 1